MIRRPPPAELERTMAPGRLARTLPATPASLKRGSGQEVAPDTREARVQQRARFQSEAALYGRIPTMLTYLEA
eukprot:857174-Pyramimonas_sp.AAC.1